MAEPKKLYEVEVSLTVFCVARSDREAEEMVRDDNLDELMETADIDAQHVTSLKQVPGSWRDAYPYGGNEKTCAAWVEEYQEYERTRPRTATELEAVGQLRLTDA